MARVRLPREPGDDFREIGCSTKNPIRTRSGALSREYVPTDRCVLPSMGAQRSGPRRGVDSSVPLYLRGTSTVCFSLREGTARSFESTQRTNRMSQKGSLFFGDLRGRGTRRAGRPAGAPEPRDPNAVAFARKWPTATARRTRHLVAFSTAKLRDRSQTRTESRHSGVRACHRACARTACSRAREGQTSSFLVHKKTTRSTQP